MTNRMVDLFDTIDDLEAAARKHVLSILSSATDGTGVRIALAGGSTPRRLYELLAMDSDVDWSRVHIYFGDERTVVHDHHESNYRMAYESLIGKVPIPTSQIHRMRGEIDPQLAADEYEATLRRTFGAGVGMPRFDLILLGIGEDGHTASLFPGTEALNESERLVVANLVPQLDTVRITLTYPVINAAQSVLFLVAGKDKAPALKTILVGGVGSAPPAARVKPTRGELRWFVDREAASDLS